MKEKPLQIISISKEDDAENSRNVLQLNEAELTSILMSDAIKDRYISVISVAGAFRKGKSFLLDFCLRYMYAKYNHHSVGDRDWIGTDDEPLSGFSWRGGSKRDTTGVLIWSEVFLHDYPDGQQVAVILMDTQGTFDCESTMQDCANIFAFSTMISSVQIFNVMSNIQKDDLQNLQLFTEYARIALTETGIKPFQKLQFLIRDWQHKSEAPYGAEGGKQILDDLLNTADNKPKENHQLCENVKTSFSAIDCFLMPHPGNAIEEPNFLGCLKDIRNEFKECLLEFIPAILAPENLIVKAINGQKLRAMHLFQYMQQYFEAFNRKTFPKPTTIFKATAEVSNQIAAEAAKDFYMSKIKDLLGSDKPHLDVSDLEHVHDELMNESIALYSNQPTLGKKQFFKKYLRGIKRFISSNLDNIKEINNGKLAVAKANFLTNLTRSLNSFDQKVEAILIFAQYIPQNEFDTKTDDIKAEIYEKFDSQPRYGAVEAFEGIRQELGESMNKCTEKWRKQNELKLEITKSFISMEYERAKKLYEEIMQDSLPSLNDSTHTDAKNRTLMRFQEVPKVGVGIEEFYYEREKQLNDYIENKYICLKTWTENKKMNLQTNLYKSKDDYEALMEKACESLLTRESLSSKHAQFKAETLKKFDELLTDPDSIHYLEDARQRLDEEIENVYGYYNANNHSVMMVFKERCSANMNNAKNKFLEIYQNFGLLATVDELARQYEPALETALEFYKTEVMAADTFNEQIFDEYRTELKDDAYTNYSWYKKRAEILHAVKDIVFGLTAIGSLIFFKTR